MLDPTRKDLAREIYLLGMELTPLIISRIEKGQRYVPDGELVMITKVLGVRLNGLCDIED